MSVCVRMCSVIASVECGGGECAVEWVVDFFGCRDARWVRCGISAVFVGHFLLLLSISCVEHEI